jgi:hypothetical protein
LEQNLTTLGGTAQSVSNLLERYGRFIPYRMDRRKDKRGIIRQIKEK